MTVSEPWQLRLPEADGRKEERFQQVASVVAAIVLKQGKDGLKFATIARRSGVSRAWLYKYFGADPGALTTFAIRLYGEAFADLGMNRVASTIPEWRAIVAEATRKGLRDSLAAPWCVQVYFRHRHTPDEIGASIRDLEDRFVERFVDEMPEPLRRDRASAVRFVEFFVGSRLGAFHRWLDPKVRERTSEDQALVELMRPLDQYIQRL